MTLCLPCTSIAAVSIERRALRGAIAGSARQPAFKAVQCLNGQRDRCGQRLPKGQPADAQRRRKNALDRGGGVLDERNGGRLEVGKVHLPSKPVQRLNIGLWRYKLHIQQTLSHVCHNSTLMPESKHFR